MSARLVNGWLEVPYDGSDRAQVAISAEPDVWRPAFLDYTDGQRVAKVRPPTGPRVAEVKLRVSGAVTPHGWLRIP